MTKLIFQWLPCQTSGIIGSALGLVGPVPVQCDCVWEIEFDLQLLSQGGSTHNCPSRSIPEIHCHAAGTLSYQQLPHACAGTDRLCVSILSLVQIVSLINTTFLRVVAHKTDITNLSLRHTCCYWHIKQASNKHSCP